MLSHQNYTPNPRHSQCKSPGKSEGKDSLESRQSSILSQNASLRLVCKELSLTHTETECSQVQGPSCKAGGVTGAQGVHACHVALSRTLKSRRSTINTKMFQPAPKYHTKGCSRSFADSPGARTLVFAAFEPFHSCEFRASIARTAFCAILWRSPNVCNTKKILRGIYFVKITKIFFQSMRLPEERMGVTKKIGGRNEIPGKITKKITKKTGRGINL